MKPMPASSMHLLTPSASSSIFTPRASSTSALPQPELMPRLPCLATRSPAPATTKAAVVEMLKLPEPSPPVPQVSTTGPETVTGTALSRITDASPAISSTVSPFKRSAVRKAAIWAGVASPSIISVMTAAACSMASDLPCTRVSMASRIIVIEPLITFTHLPAFA